MSHLIDQRTLARPSRIDHRIAVALRFAALDQLSSRTHRDFGEHQHPDLELIHTRSGTYRCRINGRRHELSPGGVLIVRPGDLHHDPLVPAADFVALRLILLPAPAGAVSADLFCADAPARCRLIDAAPDLIALIECLAALPHPETPAGVHALDALGLAVLWRIAERTPRAWLAPALREAWSGADFSTAFAAAARRLAGTVPTTAALAQELGLSVAVLKATCRRVLGQPPLAAYRQLALRDALNQLQTTALSIATIARQTGYGSTAAFCAAFRRCHGRAPGAVRQG
jgi:AraC-like DNA-binding protein